MKRILISITSLEGGGAERVAALWANKLMNFGCTVAILVYCRSVGEYEINPSIKIYSLANSYEDYLRIGKISRIKSIRKIVKLFNPDINISFLPNMQKWFMISTLGLNFFRIETIRVNPWMAVNGILNNIMWKSAFFLSDRIIVQTDEQIGYLSKSCQKKCVVVRNPVDSKFLKYSKSYHSKVKKFIAAGRLSSQKNFYLLIKAFANVSRENPNIELDIYGDGEESFKRQLKKAIREENAENIIRLHPKISDIQLAMLESDCFVLSSNYEGLPNALIEALSLGLVCISTNCQTGPSDLIPNEKTGFLIEVGNQKELENTIKKVLFMPIHELSKIGHTAREHILTLCNNKNNFDVLLKTLEIK